MSPPARKKPDDDLIQASRPATCRPLDRRGSMAQSKPERSASTFGERSPSSSRAYVPDFSMSVSRLLCAVPQYIPADFEQHEYMQAGKEAAEGKGEAVRGTERFRTLGAHIQE